jgi:hypothetical protein
MRFLTDLTNRMFAQEYCGSIEHVGTFLQPLPVASKFIDSCISLKPIEHLGDMLLQVKAGHQVEYLKAWLKDQPDAPKGSIKLFYEGKEMIDPLSFMDYRTIADTGACTVSVEFS